MFSIFGNKYKNTSNAKDLPVSHYEKKAKNVIMKYRNKGPLQFDSISGRITIAGKHSKALDELAREIGDEQAFNYCAGCVFGVAVGMDSAFNVTRLGE